MMKKLNFLSIASVGSRKRPFSYQSRIDSVSIPYRSRIVLLSFSYHSRFRKRKQYGNNMRSIYAGREDDTWWVHGGNVVDVRTGRRSVEHAKHP